MGFPRKSAPPDLATIRALRLDTALQIARQVQRTGHSQVAASRALAIPQPTLSKIMRGRVADLSLELLIRIAVRAQLNLVLHTGTDPAEAGVFVSGTGAVFVSGAATPGRAPRSRLAERARQQLSASTRGRSAELRLDAQLRHGELLADLRRGAQSLNPKRI